MIDDSSTIISCIDQPVWESGNDYLFSDFSDIPNCFPRGYTYKVFGSEQNPEFAVFVAGTDESSVRLCNLLAVTFSNVKLYYDEKFDRCNFIKNIILDNILPGDIYIKARELHFSTDVTRVVLLIRVLTVNDISVYDVIQNLFPDKQKDFVSTSANSTSCGQGDQGRHRDLDLEKWPAPSLILWAANSIPESASASVRRPSVKDSPLL